MGNHYIPQRYLEAFTETPSVKALWQFDKKNLSFSKARASINKIAQRRAFYDPETERLLNVLVERPANKVINKLSNDNYLLSEDERMFLSVYLATMLERVPYHRSKIEKMIPDILKEVTSDLSQQIRERQEAGSFTSEQARRYLRETAAVEKKYTLQLPSKLRNDLFSPWPSEDIIDAIHSMEWRFVIAEDDEYFVTSDNPVFYFESIGLGNDKSEITFPVSKHVVLFASRKQIVGVNVFPRRTKQHVREANRRLISGADRFIYSTERSDWIKAIAQKRHVRLNLIQW